jgi:hypothetical protein
MDSTSVIYLGTLNKGFKLYLTIITNTDDYLQMTPSEIQAQETYERDEEEKFTKLVGKLDPKDFLQPVYPDPTTGNHHHLAMAKKTGTRLFDMVQFLLRDQDIIVLYCIFGTHIYPVSLSKGVMFYGMHNFVDELEQGLTIQIEQSLIPKDQKLTLTLLRLMIPHFTMHKGASYTGQHKTWFPKTFEE